MFNKAILNSLLNFSTVIKPASYNYRLAAATVFRDQVIAVGFSSKHTHPFQALYRDRVDRIYWHAEVNALHNHTRNSDIDLDKCDLYVARMKNLNMSQKQAHFVPALARPCDGCLDAIIRHKIRRVVYSVDLNTYGMIDVTTGKEQINNITAYHASGKTNRSIRTAFPRFSLPKPRIPAVIWTV